MMNTTKYDKTDALSRSGAASLSPSSFIRSTTVTKWNTLFIFVYD